MKNIFHKATNAHSAVHVFWVFLFLVFIAFPLAGLFSTQDPSHIERMEKRLPAPFPAKLFQKDSFRQFEMWYGDHYPFRYDLVRFFSKSYADYAGVSIRPRDGIVGREKWLFLGDRFNQVMARYRGQKIPSDGQIAAAVARYTDFERAAAQRGIPIVIGIAPDKQRIAPEFLPRWALPGKDGPGIVTVLSELAQNGIKLTWLLPAAEEAKKHLHPLPVAFEYDSHWNGASGFFTFKTIMRELEPRVAGLFVPDADDYVFQTREGESDLTKILLLPETPSTEVIAVPRRFHLPEQVTRTELSEVEPTTSRIPLTPSHLRGASFPRLTLNPEAPLTGRVLMIADSFGTAVEPYFIQHFHETVRVPTAEIFERGAELLTLLDRFRPSFVVFIITERAAW